MTTPEEEKLMTLWEFISLTWDWIQEEAKGLGVEDFMKKIRNRIHAEHDRVVRWWNRGRVLAIAGLIIVLVLGLAGFVLGWIFNTGIFNAIAGLLVAPIIIIMLAWWIPLAGILGVASEVVRGEFKTALNGGARWAEGWMKIAMGILLWLLILSFVMTVVPYWNAPSRVPIMALCALITILMSYVWGSGKWYRRFVNGAVLGVFALNVVFCFWPATAKAINARFERADKVNAERIQTEGVLSIVRSAEASVSPRPTYVGKGDHAVPLEKGAMTGWLVLKGQVTYNIVSPDNGFEFFLENGDAIAASDRNHWPTYGAFRIVAKTDQPNLRLIVE